MNWISQFNQRIKDTQAFFNESLWRQSLPPVWSLRGLWLRCLRVVDIVVRGFKEDEVRMHAISLTYSTLMSLVPLLALSLAVLKGLGFDARLSTYVTESMTDMPDQLRRFATDILNIVENTDFAKLGGIGALIFLFMAVQMLSRIEMSFNNVWGIDHPRPFFQRIANYISVIVIVPIFLLAVVTYTANLTWSTTLAQQLGLVPFIPFLAMTFSLGFLYLAMPNTKVRYLPALISGLVGSLLWHLWFRLYITIQPGVTQYNVLYGTLASVPIFLAWLYVSWLIILIGAKVAFAVQHGGNYKPDRLKTKPDLATRLSLILHVLREAACIHASDEPGLDEQRFANHYRISADLLHDVLNDCRQAGWLLQAEDLEGIYVLAKAAQTIRLQDVLDHVATKGANGEKLGLQNRVAAIDETVDQCLTAASNHWGSKNLADLVAVDQPNTTKSTTK